MAARSRIAKLAFGATLFAFGAFALVGHGCANENFSSGSNTRAATKKLDSGSDPKQKNQDTGPTTPTGTPTSPSGSGGGPGSASSGLKSDADQTISGTADKGAADTIKDIDVDNGQFACDKGQAGMVGKVYKLPEGTGALPNLDAMTPVGQVTATTLNVPPRDWTSGFPALPGLVEWFAIKFFALLDVPADGDYQFRTNSDDGSKFYLGDDVIVNNDGIHGATVKDSASVPLKKGKRRIMVEWYQGPRVQIALQVYWKKPGADWEIIPAQALIHGSDCGLTKLGEFD